MNNIVILSGLQDKYQTHDLPNNNEIANRKALVNVNFLLVLCY
jgi:hypothetical protein